jgi:N-acetylmuramoyl-L-alanine amidase
MNRRDVLKLALGLPFLLSAGSVDALATTLAEKKAKPRPAALPLIVLDPGHGGKDPGAIGVRGTYEKHVTLDIARNVAARLSASGRHRVLLTRSCDVFLPLKQRAEVAHDQRADLFISIHADSAPNEEARGVSAYTLSETASDKFAAAIATRENASDYLTGVDVASADKEVAAILFDLTRRHSLNSALAKKARIVSLLGDKLTLLENPKRSANFAVLKVPDVPSILIETGFLSNPHDEALLSSPAARKRVAATLADAIAGAIAI